MPFVPFLLNTHIINRRPLSFRLHLCFISFCFPRIRSAQFKLYDKAVYFADTPVVHEETGPSEVNLFSGTRIIDSSQPPTKQVKPLCLLHKVLKFRVSPDSEIQAVTTELAK